MTKSRILTDTSIRALKPAPAGKRYAVADAIVPGLKVRITDRGAKSFVLKRRYGGADHAAARSLGRFGEITLADARTKARAWLALLAQGEDPGRVARRRRESERARNDVTFAAVMEEFLARHVKGQRKARDVEREMRKDLSPRWGDKPLSEISRRDVTLMVDALKDRGAPATARNVFGHAKVFFNWAIERGIYGIESSPCDRIKPGRLIGVRAPRQRVLSDAEIKAFWHAACKLDYPIGPLLRLLLLTGLRRSEMAEARWPEFNFRAKIFTIPPERFKSDSVHTVPLTDDAIALLETIPRWNAGNAVFSTTYGVKPVNGFSIGKIKLDAMMAAELGEVKPWVLHDLRRTVRTRLSALRVPDHVSEMIIGHGRKGIQRVYDQHAYVEEMREALEAWNALLREIVS
jgi:integrase